MRNEFKSFFLWIALLGCWAVCGGSSPASPTLVSLLVLLVRPRRRQGHRAGPRCFAGFQSLFSWIALVGDMSADWTVYAGLVSILVLVDRPRRQGRRIRVA